MTYEQVTYLFIFHLENGRSNSFFAHCYLECSVWESGGKTFTSAYLNCFFLLEYFLRLSKYFFRFLLSEHFLEVVRFPVCNCSCLFSGKPLPVHLLHSTFEFCPALQLLPIAFNMQQIERFHDRRFHEGKDYIFPICVYSFFLITKSSVWCDLGGYLGEILVVRYKLMAMPLSDSRK